MFVIDLQLAIYLFILLLLGIIWGVSNFRPGRGGNETAVWQNFPFGVILLSNNNQPKFANKKATQLLQTHTNQLVATPTFQQLVQNLQSGIAAEQFNLHLPTDVTITVWSGLFGKTRLVVLQDHSDQRRREHELQLFWGGISHELRTPLTSILAHAEVARSPDTTDEIQQHSLTIIQQQANRLVKLVQNALTLGRLKATDMMEKTAVNMIIIAEEAIAELILFAESNNVDLSLSCETPIPHALGNHDKLKQVFISLLDNALKYCTSGDSIMVSLSVTADHIQCEVADTGSGIPAAHLARISQQFYRVRRDVAGSGLGLAIVEEIIGQHGGTLTIESESEAQQTGTCIRFTIPQAPLPQRVTS
ncbi:MAG: GHKL domain-containing protein [Chloroflexi bacterium]|nr:MAG: GHKL domain-containing protein [Chloroflexota bacterium]